MCAVSGADQGQGRALHPLPAAQLLRAAGQPLGSRGAGCRPRDGEPGGPSMAARSGERPRARHHRRDPGRTAGYRESAVAAGPDALRRPQRALAPTEAGAGADRRPAAPAVVLRRFRWRRDERFAAGGPTGTSRAALRQTRGGRFAPRGSLLWTTWTSPEATSWVRIQSAETHKVGQDSTGVDKQTRAAIRAWLPEVEARN
jgi:hypothetical protein